jgi:bacterioferritin-associated ferredoxin
VELDDELCLCFHVTKRKVINFLRIAKLKRASQLSECYGAGTGCGWCRPYLCRLFDEASGNISAPLAEPAPAGQNKGDSPAEVEPTAADYARLRAGYVRAGGGTPPPGATPVDPDPPSTSRPIDTR